MAKATIQSSLSKKANVTAVPVAAGFRARLCALYLQARNAVSFTALSVLLIFPSPALCAEPESFDRASHVSTLPSSFASSQLSQAPDASVDTSSSQSSGIIPMPISDDAPPAPAPASAIAPAPAPANTGDKGNVSSGTNSKVNPLATSAAKQTPSSVPAASTTKAPGSAGNATTSTPISTANAVSKSASAKPALKPDAGTLAPPMKAKLDSTDTFSSNPKSSTSTNSTNSGGVKSGSVPSPFGSAPAAPPPGVPGEENYPVIGTLETSVFGAANPAQPVEERLSKLENAVFRQTFPNLSLFDRTEKLKVTLIGAQQPIDTNPDSLINRSQMIDEGGTQMQNYYDEISARPENQTVINNEDAAKFFIELINAERQKFGFSTLSIDEVASQVASKHIDELAKRGMITHADLRGNNPDRRYTTAGGTDLMFESLVSFKAETPETRKLTKSCVAQLVKTVFQRQDERDALLSSDATGLGFAMSIDADRDRFISCCDVITHHGVIQPIPFECHVGDKIEVKGVVMEPYKFERVTLAWEANANNLAKVADEAEEALPYFAPLDYGAYAKSSDKDYSQALGTLRTIGIIAAIAGGMFMPPVALAAPMIAMSGNMGNSEPKPVSDIPIKGGMHVDGNYFSGKIPINHEGKEGLYYLTVWATVTKYGKPIPISRRAILATGVAPNNSESVSAKQIKDDSDRHEKKKEKHKKKEGPDKGLTPDNKFTPPNQVQNQSGI